MRNTKALNLAQCYKFHDTSSDLGMFMAVTDWLPDSEH